MVRSDNDKAKDHPGYLDQRMMAHVHDSRLNTDNTRRKIDGGRLDHQR